MFDSLVEKPGVLPPDSGKRLAVGFKAILSAGMPAQKTADGRRHTDADRGKKKYKGFRKMER